MNEPMPLPGDFSPWKEYETWCSSYLKNTTPMKKELKIEFLEQLTYNAKGYFNQPVRHVLSIPLQEGQDTVTMSNKDFQQIISILNHFGTSELRSLSR
jgi:hypothetical protein